MLVGSLALWAVAPAVASASPEWLINGAPIASKEIKFKGTVEVAAHQAGGVWGEIKCEDSGTGFVKSKGTGEDTKMTFSKCQRGFAGGNCERELMINAAALPWKTQLISAESKILNTVPEALNPNARYDWSCVGLGSLHGECLAWYLESEGVGLGLATVMTNLAGGKVSAKGTASVCESGSGNKLVSEQTIEPVSGSLSVK